MSYLLTSRQSALLRTHLGASVRELDVVTQLASLDLFWRCCGVDANDAARVTHDAAARRICSRVCGRVPLALQMVGGVVQSKLGVGDDLGDVLRVLEDEVPSSVALPAEDVGVAGCDGVLDPRAQYGSMRECVLLSLRSVGDALRRRYMQLAVFGEDVAVSSDVLAVLWGVSATTAKSDCNMLLDRHLVMRAEGGTGGGTGTGAGASTSVCVMLHDLQRDVVVREAGDRGLATMHGSLLRSLAKRCCDALDGGGFSGVDWCALVRSGVCDDAVTGVSMYAQQHLSYHLGGMCEGMLASGAGVVDVGGCTVSLSDARRALVHSVALNGAWLVGRCVHGGGSVVGADGDVSVAERLAQRELRAVGGSLVGVDVAATLASELRVLGWVRRALELCGLVIRRDVGSCASYLWASLEPVTRECGDDATRRLLGVVVASLDACRREACVRGGGGWLAMSSAGEMSAASALARSLPGHRQAVTCVVVGCMDSSGRRCLISGSGDGTLRVWDVTTYECVHELKGHVGEVSCVSDVFVGADGRHVVASGSYDMTIRVWNVGGGTCTAVLEGHSNIVCGLSRVFVDDAGRRCVASGSADHSTRVWDVDAGTCLCVLAGHEDVVTCVSVVGTVDGRQLLASGSHDRTVRLWDAASRECVRVVDECDESVACVSGGIVDGSKRVLLASGSWDGKVRLVDVRTGECVRVLSGHSSWVMSLTTACVTVAGRRVIRLASGSDDGSLRLWDVASGDCVGVVSVPGGSVYAVSDGFGDGACGSDDRVVVATGSHDGVVRVWDVASTARASPSTRRGRSAMVRCVSDGFVDRASGRCVVASGFSDGNVLLWDVDSGECVRFLVGHMRNVTCISGAFTDGSGRQLVASGSDDRTLRLWDVGSGECHRVWSGHRREVMAISSGFDDGTGRVVIASGSRDRSVRLWDVDSSDCVCTMNGHVDRVQCLSDSYADVDSGRRFIASGSDDATVRVWDVGSGACVHVLRGHTDRLTSVSSAVVDGSGRRLLASASRDADKTIRLWDAATGECVRVLEGHCRGVTWLSGGFVDARGRHCVASTSSDRTLRVWDVASGATVFVASADEGMGFSCSRTPECVALVTTCGSTRIAVGAGNRVLLLTSAAVV